MEAVRGSGEALRDRSAICQRLQTGGLWDCAEGAVANLDVEYPQLAQPAAFVCAQKSCSSPIRKPELLLTRANPLAQECN